MERFKENLVRGLLRTIFVLVIVVGFVGANSAYSKSAPCNEVSEYTLASAAPMVPMVPASLLGADGKCPCGSHGPAQHDPCTSCYNTLCCGALGVSFVPVVVSLPDRLASRLDMPACTTDNKSDRAIQPPHGPPRQTI